jgi:hypothetical protein
VVRKVYLDFQDSYGYRDVSNLVKYESLNITMHPFSDTFHYAQNEATFTLLFDFTIFGLFKTATTNILCKIVDMYEEGYLTAENGAFLLTEAGFYLMQETGGVIPLFYGIIPATSSYKYNGVLNNTFFTCNATDSTQLLDKKVGDICYRNYKLMDPVNVSASIVHQLAYKAGFTSLQVDSTITIPTVINAISPPSEDESILTLLDTLLFDYGYTLNFNKTDQISPIQWNVTTSGYAHQFDDTNIIKEIERNEKEIQYEGVEITYNELADRSNILLYREDLPYDSTGGFAGYSIPSGYMYPPEANVIDDTTGYNQVVDYAYTDESIKYFTNKAVMKGIENQYAYKAFTSDFSSIVATSGHYLNWNADSKDTDVVVVTSGYDVTIDGEVVPTYYFGNKKARVILKNNGAAHYLYYLNINGNVLYRTAERKCLVQNVANTTKVDKYTANFLYNATDVGALAAGLAKNYQIGNITYTFPSEDMVDAGSIIRLYLDDGTNIDAVIMERYYDETEPTIYNYIVKSWSANRGALTQKRIVRYSNSTKQTYLYIGKQIVVAPITYGGYDADIYCDGTNDNEEIQSAVDYASWSGIDVKCLPGNYDIGGTIVMKQDTELFGVGAKFKINKYINPVIDMSQYTGVGINDIVIDGNKSVVTYSGSLDIIVKGDNTRVNSSYATKVVVQNFKHLENSGVPTNSSFSYVNNPLYCIVQYCEHIVTSGITDSILLTGFDNCNGATNCVFTHNTISGLMYKYSGDIAFLIGFKNSASLVDCSMVDNTSYLNENMMIGFYKCYQLINPIFSHNFSSPVASGNVNPSLRGFSGCMNIETALVDYNTTSGYSLGTINGFAGCDHIGNSTIHNNNSKYIYAFTSSNNINNCRGYKNVKTISGGSSYGLYGCYSAHLNIMLDFDIPYNLAYASATASGIYACYDSPNGGFNS